MAFPPPPPLTKEHGAWTMLTIPMLLGLAAGGAGSAAAWLIAPATVLVFLAHYAIVPWIQRAREGKPSPSGYASRRLTWGTIYLLGAGTLFAAAILTASRDARSGALAIAAASAALAAVYALSASLGSGRALAAEVIGMCGMALTAPMMAAAAGRVVAPGLFGSAALALSYFLSSVAFVRSYDGLKTDRARATQRCAAAHAAIAAGLIAAAVAGILPPLWWAALLPVALRTAWGLASPPPTLRALGLREIWVAVSFTALAAVGLVLQ